ncbi:MAG TPA: CBS domain-containing protein [Jiangellales bacterium]|nr:CBS domain-containing protein [Jiangellales bacterium]
MRVAEIMTKATVTDSHSGTLQAAAEIMWRQQTGSIVIVEGGELVGIVTERDVLKVVASGQDVAKTVVGDVMTTGVITVGPDTPIRDAARTMAQHWIRHLPVVADGELVGIISQRDVTGIFAALWRDAGFPEIDTDSLVRARRLERLEPGDLD